MKISAETFVSVIKNFKSFWARLPSAFRDGGEKRSCKMFSDLSDEDSCANDQDMERLVRMIEETRDGNSLRY